MTKDPNILTADETAAMIGLSRTAVYVAASRGEIPHRRVGRRLLFYKPAIVAWLSGKVAPTEGDSDASAA